MTPLRCAAMPRPVRVAILTPVVLLATLLTGCVANQIKSAPELHISNQEAIQAGSLAYYASGILLQNTLSGDTNLSHRAALEAFHKAIRLNPDSRNALFTLVSILADAKQHQEALEVLEHYLKRHRDDFEAHTLAARAAEELGQLSLAARHCKAILAYKPDKHEIFLALISFYFQDGKSTQALRAMRRQLANSHNKKSIEVPITWGSHFAYVDQQPKLALQCLKLAIPYSTNQNQRALLTAIAAQQYLSIGNTNQAQKGWIEAFHIQPESLDSLKLIGASFAQTPDAAKKIARLTRRETSPATALFIHAARLHAEDNREGALDTLRQLFNLPAHHNNRRSIEFFLWYASLLMESGQERTVIDVLDVTLHEHPDSHEAANFLAYTLALRSEQLPKALLLIDEALMAEPDNAAYLDTRGWVLFKQQRRNEALQYLLKAAEKEPDDPEILDHVAVVLKELGHNAEANFLRVRLKELAATNHNQ